VYMLAYMSFDSCNFSLIDVFDSACIMSMEDSEALLQWYVDIGGITEVGRSKLEKATIVSLGTVKNLTLQDILEVKLGVGDRANFRAGWEVIIKPVVEVPVEPVVPVVPVPEPVVVPEEASADTKLYSIAEISKFFGSLSSREASGSVLQQSPDGRREALAAAASVATGFQPAGVVGGAAGDVTVRTLAKDRLLNRLASEFIGNNVDDSLVAESKAEKGEKPLLPINFATVFNGVVADDEEILGCGTGAGRLVWQSGKGNLRKPTPDRLSYGQFFEANARILKLLNLDAKTESEYLEYLRQIGILLQTFTTSSVFCLDHIHRLYIHETGSQWNIIENTLENSVLKKKDDSSRHAGQSSPFKKRDFQRDGRQSDSKPVSADAVCYLYNLFKGCPFSSEQCKYPHVCGFSNGGTKCRQRHPAYMHNDSVAPRFRSGDSKSSA
jgi:hypothetical protein